MDARITFKPTPSPSANAALVAVTTLPQTIETTAWADALQIIGSAPRDQLVQWEAALSDPNEPMPGAFAVGSSRDGLLTMVQRIIKEQDDLSARSHGTKLTHINGLYAVGGGAIGFLLGLLF